jgi:hypothetical protein
MMMVISWGWILVFAEGVLMVELDKTEHVDPKKQDLLHIYMYECLLT